MWSLIVTVLNRLLAQSVLGTEDAFLDSIRDVYVAAGQNPWVVTLAVFMAHFIALAP